VRIDVFTIFPDLIEGYCGASLVGRARQRGVLDLRVRDLRAGASDARRSVDDAPFGGGAGMVLMPEPLFAAVERVEEREDLPRPLFLLSPGGRRFDESVARDLAGGDGFSLLCGRYEGVDQRVADHLADSELSVGDVVVAGGELPALVVVEAVTRLLPGALGNEASTEDESFRRGLLEYPQYTRPADFRGWVVPEVLRSGDHKAVEAWRRVQSLRRTLERRPDLVAGRGGLTDEEVTLLAQAGEVQLLADHGYDAGLGNLPADPKDAPCTPPRSSTATACATTSPSSDPATP
jgi:tRNA (guanine37-N1)-methyltransferase